MLDRSLRNRYSRQTVFPGIGEEGQVRLLGSSAVVMGCGARPYFGNWPDDQP